MKTPILATAITIAALGITPAFAEESSVSVSKTVKTETAQENGVLADVNADTQADVDMKHKERTTHIETEVDGDVETHTKTSTETHHSHD